MRFALDPLVSAGVQGRTRVDQLLPSNVREALTVANAIGHPWYRCQALTAAGDVMSDDKAARAVLMKALRAAHELTEPNRIVTIASWPLRVLVRRNLGHVDIDIDAEVERLLAIVAAEPHSLRRADALSWLISSVFANPALRQRVLSALLASLSVSHGWRAERNWAGLVELMREESAEAGERILQAMPEGRAKRRVSRATPPPASPPAPA